MKKWKEVSVPCRGTTFLNHAGSHTADHDQFPSPVGELHFSIRMGRNRSSKRVLFPSPVGELHFSIMLVSIREVAKTVSVPCRGTTFLNPDFFFIYGEKKKAFPSPVGELHFSIPSLQSRHQSGLMVGIAWEKYFWKNK